MGKIQDKVNNLKKKLGLSAMMTIATLTTALDAKAQGANSSQDAKVNPKEVKKSGENAEFLEALGQPWQEYEAQPPRERKMNKPKEAPVYQGETQTKKSSDAASMQNSENESVWKDMDFDPKTASTIADALNFQAQIDKGRISAPQKMKNQMTGMVRAGQIKSGQITVQQALGEVKMTVYGQTPVLEYQDYAVPMRANGQADQISLYHPSKKASVIKLCLAKTQSGRQ